MKFNFNDAQPILLFEVLIVQCQNRIKYILLRSLSAAMFTWPCKTNFTTVPDPLKLQILLEDKTATDLLFQSYAATTTIDRMTWLACISHYVRGHVHKTGHNYNGTKANSQAKLVTTGPGNSFPTPRGEERNSSQHCSVLNATYINSLIQLENQNFWCWDRDNSWERKFY